jgi:hypothetical protein
MSQFGHERLKVVYTAAAPEFHPTEDRQTRDEELIWSLFNPMLALSLLTKPVEWAVPREPDYDDGYMEEMKGIFGEKNMWAVEFMQWSEKLGIEQNPTRQATSFPVKLIGIDNMPLEGHPGLEFLKAELGEREILTVADIEAIAAKWKAR